MLLEVIALTEEDAMTASRFGADRIELVSVIEEGGLTPDASVISQVAAVCTIPMHIMIRPHSRSFQYSEADLADMIRSIEEIRAMQLPKLGAFVLGVLNADQTVDEEQLKALLEAAGDVPVTFHRAFDEVRDQAEALDTLMRYPQVRTVLTSGGVPNVLHATEQIAKLVRQVQAKGSALEILAGSGLTVEAVSEFVEATPVRAVHFGSGVRENGSSTAPIDSARLSDLRAILNQR
ncbi:copper homeostasis protein CutC [Paenibacillus sp. OV219]|uniref:copper homeostasis protein CutC n=1 Tax=Paenibacillus sp. OV219 TaxID=1884377 RepID=UPI0008BF4223|nr:copper homeostasis protein CutC [Paenibacillus sp. OV219]SEO54135.1 copper homeostasis protein [Paenibacillus sp. OV219]